MSSAVVNQLETLQAQVENAVSESTKAQLTECARLLATYVALYKQQFGELTNQQYADINERLSASREFGESVYSSGLREMLDTLALVEIHDSAVVHHHDATRTLN